MLVKVSPARVVEPGRDRERLAFRYIQGMEQGDDELIGAVLARALDDDQLWEIIERINLEYQREEGLI